MVDQDALNKKFFRLVQWLPWEKYNCPAVVYLSKSQTWGGDVQALIPYALVRKCAVEKMLLEGYDVTPEITGKAAILHFCTQDKPWREPDAFRSDSRGQMLKCYQRYERMLQKII